MHEQQQKQTMCVCLYDFLIGRAFGLFSLTDSLSLTHTVHKINVGYTQAVWFFFVSFHWISDFVDDFDLKFVCFVKILLCLCVSRHNTNWTFYSSFFLTKSNACLFARRKFNDNWWWSNAKREFQSNSLCAMYEYAREFSILFHYCFYVSFVIIEMAIRRNAHRYTLTAIYCVCSCVWVTETTGSGMFWIDAERVNETNAYMSL